MFITLKAHKIISFIDMRLYIEVNYVKFTVMYVYIVNKLYLKINNKT